MVNTPDRCYGGVIPVSNIENNMRVRQDVSIVDSNSGSGTREFCFNGDRWIVDV